MRAALWGLALVLLACALTPVHAQTNTYSFNYTIPQDGKLAALIGNMTLLLPDFTFDFEDIPVNATNIVCVDLVMYALGAEIVAQNFSQATGPHYELLTINATAYGLNLTCTGNYSYTVLRQTEAGNMTMTLGNNTLLNLFIDVAVTEGNSTTNSTSPPPAPAPPSSNSTSNMALEFAGMIISPEQIIAAFPFGNLMGFKNPALLFQRQTEEDDTTEIVPPPTLAITLGNCSMVPWITSLVTDSFTLNTQTDALIAAITPEIPVIVCAQLEELVNITLNTALNSLISDLWIGLQTLEDPNAPEIFKKEATFYAFLGATLLWVILVAWFVAFPIMYKRYVKKKYGDAETDPLTGSGLGPVKYTIPADKVPLIMHPKLHWFWKYSVLLALLWNIALFISANISVASSVYLYLTIGKIVTKLPALYTFLLWDSVVEMWDAGVWPLSLLIGITSGVWPYIKLIAMLICWVVPPRWLPDKYRLYLLRILDALGKWSLIDVYVLVLFLESFRVHIELTSALQLDMAVTVQYAFYSYLAATMISLILTHVFLFINHRLVEPKIPKTGYQMLCSHHFVMCGRTINVPLVGKILVVFCLFLTAAVGIAGAMVTAFQFSWEGSLIGLLLQVTGEPTTATYSIFSLVRAIPETTFNDPDNVGIRLIQVAFVMFVFAIPMAHMICLGLLWLVPLTATMQHGFYAAVEILNAWSAMDVFLVALIVALVELGTFSDFIAMQACSSIDPILQAYFPNTGGTCFKVAATLEEGVWILLGAVVLVLVVGYTVMYLCDKAITERLTVERKLSNAKLAPQSSDYDDLFAEDYFPSNTKSTNSLPR